MKLVVSAAVAAAGACAFGVTEKTWSNTAGDWDLGNAENWGGTLPTAPDYNAKISKGSTDDQPFVMSAAKVLKPNQIQLNEANYTSAADPMFFDLGESGVFLALTKFIMYCRSATLKSGTVGVDWESATGDRFFIGDRSSDGIGSVFTVDGPTAKISSAYKNNILVGTNARDCRLVVKNGGTVSGNMVVGANATATDCTAWFEGPGTTHVIPEGGSIDGLVVGSQGMNARYVLTNGASFFCPALAANKHVRIGEKSPCNTLEVLDHSSFTVKAPLYVGYGDYNIKPRGTNTMVIAGHSTAVCDGGVYVGANGIEAGSRNRLLVLDGSTLVVTNANEFFIGGSNKTADESELVISNATVDASNTAFQFGRQGATYGDRLLVQDGGRLVSANRTRQRFWLGSAGHRHRIDVYGGTISLSNLTFFVGGTDVNCFSNVLHVSGGVFAVTNTTQYSSQKSSLGCYGSYNSIVVDNGGLFSLTETYNQEDNHFYIGENATAEYNTVVISNGARWVQSAVARGYVVIGLRGAKNGLLVDGGSLDLSSNNHIVNIGSDTSASNCWMTVRNGATATLARLIVGIKGRDCELAVDDATLAIRQFQFGDTQDLGTKFTISGDRAKIDANTLDLAPDMTLNFKIDERGLRTDDAVLTVTNGIFTTSKVAAEHPVTIKIDADQKVKDGTYTLMKVTGEKKTIAWTNVNLDYDPKFVKEVVQTDTELTVTVRRRKGLMLIIR